MSSDCPVYTGPTNVYLAYPVQGPDGRGYITQSFTPPGSYLSQDSGRYSYNSTPEHSGPTSPPPPLTHSHDTNWGESEISNTYAQRGGETQRQSTPKPDHPVSHIPGLVYKLESSQKKTSKKRKKKNKEDLSTQDEIATCSDRAESLHPCLSSRDGSAELIEPVQEVCLTA